MVVAEFGVPTEEEKRHQFLWRFVPCLPGWGEMSVFDRSWYGRVLVERVEGFANNREWKRAYAEINNFEEMLVEEGVTLVKVWLHISSDEQERRFEARRNDPLRRWKLTDDDWRNREKRPAYLDAAEEMFERTDSKVAPWEIVAAESKHYAVGRGARDGDRPERDGDEACRADDPQSENHSRASPAPRVVVPTR